MMTPEHDMLEMRPLEMDKSCWLCQTVDLLDMTITWRACNLIQFLSCQFFFLYNFQLYS